VFLVLGFRHVVYLPLRSVILVYERSFIKKVVLPLWLLAMAEVSGLLT